MFRFKDKTDENSELIKDWKAKQLNRGSLQSKDPEYLSAFSLLSEWQNGGARSLARVYQTCVSLGKVDASLAWVVGVSNSAWSMLGNFPETVVREINYPIVSMVLGRPGSVIFDESQDTAVIEGEWRYCSGFEQAGGFIGLVKDAAPESEVYVCLIPTEDLRISEPWDAIGLKETGSHTIRATGVQVRRDALVPYTEILKGDLDVFHIPSYRSLFTGVLMNCLTGSIVGATLNLLDLAIEKTSGTGIGGSSYSLGKDSGSIRTSIGTLSSKMEEIYEFGAGGAAFVDEVANGNEDIWTTHNRALLRARASSVMKQCREVADEALWIMGSSVLTESNPVASIWQDIHVGALHGGFSKYIPEEALGLSTFNEDPLTLTKML